MADATTKVTHFVLRDASDEMYLEKPAFGVVGYTREWTCDPEKAHRCGTRNAAEEDRELLLGVFPQLCVDTVEEEAASTLESEIADLKHLLRDQEERSAARIDDIVARHERERASLVEQIQKLGDENRNLIEEAERAHRMQRAVEGMLRRIGAEMAPPHYQLLDALACVLADARDLIEIVRVTNATVSAIQAARAGKS